jgi:peptidyl-dipeptidase A
MWVSPYDTADFKDQIAAVWEEMTPWYKKIHAYVRRKLIDTYGEDKIDPTGPIPAQLLGENIQ